MGNYIDYFNHLYLWKIIVFNQNNSFLKTIFKFAESLFITGFIKEATIRFLSTAAWQLLWDGIRIGLGIILFIWN